MTQQPVQARSKRVWIDLDNTPHVPFFLPIIRALEREGHSVLVTARDAFQVCAVADYHGLAYAKVGRHYGANKAMKVAGTVWRAAQLLPAVLREKPDISMSHGSRSLVLVSALLRIPTMLLFDYEHAERLPFLKPALGVAPEAIADPALAGDFRYGLRSYGGLKEDVYAATFRPDPSILADLGAADEDILVTIRPPATEAHYHNPEAETLFVEVVEFLGAKQGVRMVILPRTAGAQREFVYRTWPRWCEERKIIIPQHALDGLNLVWFSDLVVSGGGTMNREAAALGVPVYSIFRGKLGAVDRYLAREGRLVLIESREDVRSKLRVVKRAKGSAPASAARPALGQILSATHELMELSDGRQ
jgi:predicted glycosyltransferase